MDRRSGTRSCHLDTSFRRRRRCCRGPCRACIPMQSTATAKTSRNTVSQYSRCPSRSTCCFLEQGSAVKKRRFPSEFKHRLSFSKPTIVIGAEPSNQTPPPTLPAHDHIGLRPSLASPPILVQPSDSLPGIGSSSLRTPRQTVIHITFYE